MTQDPRAEDHPDHDSTRDADDPQDEPGLMVEQDDIDLDDTDPDDTDPDDTDPDDTDPDEAAAHRPDDGDEPAGDDTAVGDQDDELRDADLQDQDGGVRGDDQEDTHAALFGPVIPHSSGEPPPPDEPGPDDPSRHRGRRVLLALVAVFAVLYVAGWFLTGTRMPADASVGGVDVSGKSPAAARAAVDEVLTPRVDEEIVLENGKKEFRVDPEDAGLAFDLDRTMDAAGGTRSWNPADIVGLFFGEHETAPALDVDESKLQSVIGSIGETVNRDVVEAQITFPDAKAKDRQPKPGRVVARADAAAAIRQAYLVTDEPIDVPTATVEPAVDSDGLTRAMTDFAEPAMSGPVTLNVGEKEVSLPVSAYAPALVVQVKDSRLTPHIDPKKLAKPLTDSTTGIGKKARDATVRIEDGKPVVVPGKKGVGLQPKEMATKLVPALSKTGDDRAVGIKAKVVEPEFTTKEAKALKITEKISDFQTEFPYAEYRNTNQGRAADNLNGTILKPGDTFSFNDTVGERTAANGFVNGTVINGGVFREELGGGVSQVATTTYNAGFFGGMDDTEHHPHAFYIDRYPVGREATVYFGSLDLRFKNPTKYGVLIRAYVVKSTPSSAGEMHVELWSTKKYDVKAGKSAKRNFRDPGKQYDDTDRCVPQGAIRGFDIDIYRTFYQGGKKVRSETDTAAYQAADTVICGKKPKDD